MSNQKKGATFTTVAALQYGPIGHGCQGGGRNVIQRNKQRDQLILLPGMETERAYRQV